jgi:mRNA-degrading endonuclease YafQ of YafQ-DinJ toxin-antitoxin module
MAAPPWGCDLVYPPSFVKAFKKSYDKIVKKNPEFQKTIDDTIEQIYWADIPPGLRPEKINKQKGIWSVKVNDNYRISFQIIEGRVHLRNIGNHDYIYIRP